MAQPLLLIAAGGTGGHMFPAQALAEGDAEARLAGAAVDRCARRALHRRFSPCRRDRAVSSATFARGGLMAKARVAPRIAAGVLGMARQMRRDRPDVVVGFGGYPSIPALAAAVLLKLPRMIHEQNGVLGRVNQLFASRVACGGLRDLAHRSARRGVEACIPATRCAAVLDRAGASYIVPGDYPMSILVMGGSQGARILSDVVPDAIANLPDDIRRHLRVGHQARPEDIDRVTAAYARVGHRCRGAAVFSGTCHAACPRRNW